MGTLRDSNFCRLCASDSNNTFLILESNGAEEIYSLINEYLHIKIKEDEKLPKKICAECKINLQNVVKFFNSIMEGQKKLLEKIAEENENYVALMTLHNRKDEGESAPEVLKHCSPSDTGLCFAPEENKEENLQNKIDNSLKIFTCNTCGKEFNHRNSIIYHVHSKHGENKLYNCSKCGKEFASPRLLNRHIKRIHALIRLFECVQCHATFTSEVDLGAHLQSCCKQSTITCKVCKKICEFGHAHKCKADEKTAKEYRCLVCNKTFPYSSNLYRHQKLHSNERPYQCTKCNRKFPTLSRLTMHENEHKKEYSYKCDVCQKTFVNNRILQVHNRKHSRIFPYQCDVCRKEFADKCSLAKHTRIHTGERPYRCDLCGKSFADQSNLLRHKKAHSKENNAKSNEKKSTSSYKVEKPNPTRRKCHIEIDKSSMTYGNPLRSSPVSNNRLEDEKSTHASPTSIYHTNHFPDTKKSLSKFNILQKAIENVIHEFDDKQEKKSNPSETKISENTIEHSDEAENSSSKKCIYFDNAAKQFLLFDSGGSERNVVILPPILLDSTKTSSQIDQEKLNSSSLVLKKQNSYFIVKKGGTNSASNSILKNDSAKLILLRSSGKNKSKIIMQRSLKNKNVTKDLPNSSNLEDDSGPVDDRSEMENEQYKLPELYSYEEMVPSPISSDYIDVENLVATFTPNISFEEIGDLNDLVNTKIDL